MGGEPVGMVERDLPDFGVNSERNCDEVIQHCLEVSLAKLAVIAVVDTLQTPKTLNNT